jgi:subtilisin family serine protease
MQRWVMAVIASCLVGSPFCVAQTAPWGTDWPGGPDRPGGYTTTHVIVRVLPGVAPTTLRDGRPCLARTQSGEPAEAEIELGATLAHWSVISIVPAADPAPGDVNLARQLGLDRYYLVQVPRGTDTPAFAAEMARFATHIESAELDSIGGILSTFPNDPSFNVQYGLHNTGQNIQGHVGTPDADIDAPEAWDLHTGTADVIIAVVDTGVSQSHPDLAGKFVTGRNFNGGDPNDTDDSPYVSHGTHCAGIAAARTNNGQGIAGVCWGARIMPIKVLDEWGFGEESEAGNGFIWAADHGAQVISISLGYSDGTSFFHDAVIYAHTHGVVIAASTGNAAGATIRFPARWSETIAVGATNNRDVIWENTTTGPEMKVTAPGVDIYSCWDVQGSANTYAYESGTSMACPHVSGLAALVKSANPALTNVQIEQIIEVTADDRGATGWDPIYGWGRINTHRAVQAAISLIPRLGDLDCDGAVDFDDIDPFVLALAGQAAYEAEYPTCRWLNADCNADGVVTFDDIDPFVALIGG